MTGRPPASNPSSNIGVPVPAPAARPTPTARERVVDLLQLRFADDCLSMDEFERRVALAYQVKKVSELDTLVADLAPADLAPADVVAAGNSGSAVPEHGRIVTILSNNVRNGFMPVPRHLEIVSVMGNVELDMSDATFAPGVTDIEISAVFGNVEITVPFGIRVESSGNALLGNFDYQASNVVGYRVDTDHVLRITGHAVFSSVEIGAAPPRMPRQPNDAPRRLT